MFTRLDLKKDGHIDFSEFVQYVTEHERQLKLSFKEFDKNDDGTSTSLFSSTDHFEIHLCLIFTFMSSIYLILFIEDITNCTHGLYDCRLH